MTVTEYFTRLQGKRVLVLGLGVSNRPLVRLLLRFGIDVTAATARRGRSSTGGARAGAPRREAAPRR